MDPKTSKQMDRRALLIEVLMLLGCLQAFGQGSRREVCIGFPVGVARLDTAFADNAERLGGVVSFLDSVQSDSRVELVEVAFFGSASPEGGWARNKSLAKNRRLALEHYIRGRVTLPDSIIRRSDEVIAWERLALMVEASEMPHKDEVMHVLRNVPEWVFDRKGALVDSRKKRLMDLRGGRAWHYMHQHFFGDIRNASVVVVTIRQKVQTDDVRPDSIPLPDDKPEVPPVADTPVVVTKDEDEVLLPQRSKAFCFALKTNMLYDLLAVPNIGVEVLPGHDWSVTAGWMYGWWNSNKRHRYWRIYGGDLAVRKWFGTKPGSNLFTGHHVGLYGQVFTYDVEWGGKGYMGGEPGGSLWKKANYAAGLEYGYAMPIAKHLNLDFSLGLGYWGGKFYKYTPLDGHYVWQATKNRRWFGPTKAEISLVWLLGRGNGYDKKGGAK